MTVTLTKIFASFLRLLPDFRGKHRIGTLWEKVILRSARIGEAKVAFKRGDIFYLDPLSSTHNGAFWTGRYDDSVIIKFCSLFERDWVVYDVGANIGYYTIPFAKRLKALNGSVYAFEPVPSNFKRLQENINANDLKRTVKLFSFALGSEESTVEMKITEPGNSSNAYMGLVDIESIHTFQSQQVEVKTLDRLMHDGLLTRCDFIKADIEGAEIFLFQGGSEFIKKFLPIVYGEFNSFFLSKFGYTFLDVWELFRNYGYSCYQQVGNSDTFRSVVPSDGATNILLLPPAYSIMKLAALHK